jgi:hypothetical protein
MQLNVNSFQYGIQVIRNLRIPEPDDAITLSLKPELSHAITPRALVVVVMPAIELDNETCGGAEEINDVGTDRCLATEVRAGHGWFFQGALMGCGV